MEEYEKLRLQLVEKVQEINNRLRQYRAANARLLQRAAAGMPRSPIDFDDDEDFTFET